MCKTFNICGCPATVSFEDLPLKPMTRTPLDKLGFFNKCCGCISLKCAVICICILSFFWAAYELQSADKFISSMIPSRNDFFYYFKMFYLLWCICFIMACGILMLGIIVERFQLLNFYIWSAFIFCCSYVIITMVGTIIAILNSGSIDKKTTMRTVGVVIWSCFFIYLIMVVNSYKLTVWYKNIGLQ